MQNNIFQIYLAGGMQDLSFDEQNEWREKFCKKFIWEVAQRRMSKKVINIINPVDYYNLDKMIHDTEKEVVNFDTNFVRNSDLIVVNANDPRSIGTSMEIAIAHEHHIPILILNEKDNELHPWWIEMSDKVFNDVATMRTYIIDFYIRMNNYFEMI